jgi:hypothetical protein
MVAAAVLVLDEVARFSELGGDRVRAALGDVHHSSDVTQAHLGILHDAEQDAGVVGQKAPLRHDSTTAQQF